MSTTDRSFKNYVKSRLEARDGEYGEIRRIKDEYISSKIEGILNDLGLDKGAVKMTTIRVASSDETRYLRPIYADPLDTVKTARDLSANNQLLYARASSTLKGIRPKRRYMETGSQLRFAAVDCLDDRTNGKHGLFINRIDGVCGKLASSPTDRPNTCFFCVRARKQEYAGDSETEALSHEATHILAIYLKGDLEEIEKSTVESAYEKSQALFDELDAIMNLDSELFKLEGSAVVADVQPVFFNPDLAPADKIAFMIERLKQLLQVHLELHHVKEQPDDDGMGKQEKGEKQTASEISVHYVSLAYEFDGDGVYTPIFQIYPHVYRQRSPYPALCIAHPEIPSASKFLLYHYFKSYEDDDARKIVLSATSGRQPVTLSSSFKAVFESAPAFNDIIDAGNRRNLFKATRPDQIHVHEPITTQGRSNGHGQLPEETWKALNVVVDVEKPNKATVAFAIEGDVVHDRSGETGESDVIECRRLPRAIVAIESPDIDFLSKSERETVREILVHMSALIRHLFHDNSLLDYRKSLSKAYESYVPANASIDKSRSLVARLLLCAMSVDVKVLGKILRSVRDQENPFSNLNDCLLEFYKKLRRTIVDDAHVGDDKVVKDSIEARLNLAIEFIGTQSEDLQHMREGFRDGADEQAKHNAEELKGKLEDFLVFLEACPQNFAWAGYSPSLAEALGDRAESAAPSFSLIAPGFSAAGLYMAVVKDEIQQVAKLSNVAKLKSELDRYRRHVRYKVVAAARTPATGLAFDTTGVKAYEWVNNSRHDGPLVLEKAEQKDYDKKAYGVLISDLAAADMSTNAEQERTVRTLLNQIAALVGGRSPNRELSLVKNCEVVAGSIDRLFRTSTKLWRTGVDRDKIKFENTRETLELTFRLENTGKRFAGYIDGQSEAGPQYNEDPFPLNMTLSADEMKNLLDFEHRGTVTFKDDDDPPMHAIVHGDLNSRNLAWSAALEHYILIDFEHTEIGIWGSDQARLVVNLIVELYSGVGIGDISPFHESIESICDWMKNVWGQYGDQPDRSNTFLIYAEEDFNKWLRDRSEDKRRDIEDMPPTDLTVAPERLHRKDIAVLLSS